MPAEPIGQKRILCEQLLLLPISLFTGYVFASLRISNRVKYFPLNGVSADTFILAAILALIIYGAVTAVLRTKGRAYAGKLFKVFDIEKKLDFTYLICALFFFFVIFAVTVKLFKNSDYGTHTELALSFDWRNLTDSFLKVSYPLWHICVNLLNKVFCISGEYAAPLVSAAFYTLEYSVIRKLAITYNKELAASKIKLIDFLLLSLMFIQPIYVPFFNPRQVVGQGTPNNLHNPTIIAVYAIALICVYLFVQMLQKLKDNEEISFIDYARSSIFLFLSVAAKPSFIQIFAPAVAAAYVIILIKTKGKALSFELKYLLSCIPAGLYCIAVFLLSFLPRDGTQNGGVGFSFFYVWRTKTMSIPISLLLGFGFPIAYISVQKKNIQNKLPYFLSLICLLFGILEYGFLYEKGYRMYHGNFGWGYLTGMTLVYVFTVIDWIKPFFERKKSMIIPAVVYSLHLICGFWYYIDIFSGKIYY